MGLVLHCVYTQVYQAHWDRLSSQLKSATKALEAQQLPEDERAAAGDMSYLMCSEPGSAPAVLEELHKCTQQVQQLQAREAAQLAAGRAAARAALQAITRRLVSELDSAGNFRVEEGAPGQAWFQSCCELLTSRLGEGANPLEWGIKGVKVCICI